MPAPWPPDAVLVHLSDLHLTTYSQDFYGEAGEWAKYAKGQDYSTLVQLVAHVHPLLQKYRDRIVVALTGDVTTAAEPPAYEMACTFLRGELWTSSSSPLGLQIGDRPADAPCPRILAVPGNHDVWLTCPWVTKWKHAQDRREVWDKYFPLPSGQRVFPMQIGPVSLLFFLLDSNELDPSWLTLKNLVNVLGKGEIGRKQLAEIQAAYTSLECNRRAALPKGFDWDGSFRIALLHHPLAVPDAWKSRIDLGLVLLSNAATVRDLLTNHLGVKLVLCGHEHSPFLWPSDGSGDLPPWQCCAGTAAQRENAQNSFFVYWMRKSLKGIEVQLEQYIMDSISSPIPKFMPRPHIRIS